MTGSAIKPRVYMASAGTGKTYQLTLRALALMTRRVAPESILATTFTRKAAGEIMERIVGRMVEAAEDEATLAKLGHELGDASVSRAQCLELLGEAMRNVHRLGVQTLDAFLAKLAALRGLEVGLPPGWRILDTGEFADLAQTAMAQVLDEADEEEIVELLRRIQAAEPQRSAYLMIERLVRESHAIFRESTPEAWEALPPLPTLGEEELAGHLEELRDASLPQTAAGKPHKSWVKAVSSAVAAVEAQEWETMLGGGLAKKVAAGEGSFDRKPIEGRLLESLQALVGHARAEIVETLRARGRAQRELLGRFDRALAACKRARRLFAFDDLPHALLRGSAEALTDESTALRLDGGIHHLLLDEFQDTSVMQGRVLEPLIASVLREGAEGSFFCVGDVKQSIYGWRQGEPRLLQSLAERHPGIEVLGLEDNYRSSSVVLSSVEQVFEGVAASAQFAGKEAMRAAAVAWKETFKPPCPKKDLPGRVALIEVASEGGPIDERRREVLDHAVEHVAQLAAEAPGASIGVLVRRRAAMPAIIYGLMERGISASGEGGNPLTDSDAVRVALSALTLAEHPGDTAAYFHVATSAFASHFEVVFEAASRRSDAARLSARIRRDLSVEGYGRFLARMQEHVGREAAFDAWDRERFGQLVDMAFALDEAGGPDRPGRFVDRVWEEHVEAPTQAAVKVMTIHGSKGLEFDAVVLPDLEGRMAGNKPPLLTRRPDPWNDMDMVAPYSKWNHLHPVLEQLAAEAEGRALREELCVLYVAMTRAARRLDMLVPGQGRRAESSSLADLLREMFGAGTVDGGEGGADDEEPTERPAARVLWMHPESVETWHDSIREGAAPAGTALAEEAASPAGVIELAPAGAGRWLPRAAPSGRASAQRIDPARLLRLTEETARIRGLLVHAWLSGMEWLEDWAPTDDELHRRAARVAREEGIVLPRDRVEQELADFRSMLRQPGVRSELSRGEQQPGEVEVWRERPFAVKLPVDGCPAMVRGAFDRVVLRREGGRLIAADVLDYKTDAPAAPAATSARGQQDLFAGDGLEARAAHYRPQMESYREVLASLTGLPAAAIRCRLLFLAAGRVVEV